MIVHHEWPGGPAADRPPEPGPDIQLRAADVSQTAATAQNTAPRSAGQPGDWRPISGFAGFYVAHRGGMIRSLDRVVETCDGRTVRLPGVVLTPMVDRRNGALSVSLSMDGRRHTRRVAALVLAAFGEPQPRPFDRVRHLDGDRANCALDNLVWSSAWDAEAAA